MTSVGVHEEAAHFFAHRIFRHLFEVAAAASPLGAKRACSFYVSCLRHLVSEWDFMLYVVMDKGKESRLA